MKKSIAVIALLLALVMCLTACSGQKKPEPTAAPTEAPNTAPSIQGAADQTVEAGTEFDALAGLSAPTQAQLDRFLAIAREFVPETQLRGA